jgi:putative flippase GtrA
VKTVAPFLIVGTLAAAIHQIVVVGLVELTTMVPAYANPIGFLLAWLVSYTGHRRYTFKSDAPHLHAMPRFFAISVFSLMCNQGGYVLLLNYTPLHYWIALFITLVVVAAMTYVLSAKLAFGSYAR